VLCLCGSFVLKTWFYENLRLYHGNLRGERDRLKLTRVSLCTAQRSKLRSQDFSGVHEETEQYEEGEIKELLMALIARRPVHTSTTWNP